MEKPVSCAFNMDSGCVELKWSDGLTVCIICEAVERSFETTLKQRTEMEWLIWNEPLSYAKLVLSGELEAYLRRIS